MTKEPDLRSSMLQLGGFAVALTIFWAMFEAIFLDGWPRSSQWVLMLSSFLVVAFEYLRRGRLFVVAKRIVPAVWAAFALCIGVAVYLRATAPLPGLLIPDDAELPDNSYTRACQQAGEMSVVFGTNVVAVADFPAPVFTFVDTGRGTVEDALQLVKDDTGRLLVNAKIRAADGRLVAWIQDNLVKEPVETARVEWLEGNHGLSVRDGYGDEVLRLKFISQQILLVERGVFRFPGLQTLVVEPGWIRVGTEESLRDPNGPGSTMNCVGSGGRLVIDPDGESWGVSAGNESLLKESYDSGGGEGV